MAPYDLFMGYFRSATHPAHLEGAGYCSDFKKTTIGGDMVLKAICALPRTGSPSPFAAGTEGCERGKFVTGATVVLRALYLAKPNSGISCRQRQWRHIPPGSGFRTPGSLAGSVVRSHFACIEIPIDRACPPNPSYLYLSASAISCRHRIHLRRCASQPSQWD